MLENHAREFYRQSFEELEQQVFPSKRKKIMVIDDDQDFRLSVCETLVDEGYAVTTAKDGEVALNSLVHHNDLPDLIIVDLLMPVKTGLEFRREQLHLDGISSIPVIFVTGQGHVEGESCLMKPFDDREFLNTVRNLLARST